MSSLVAVVGVVLDSLAETRRLANPHDAVTLGEHVEARARATTSGFGWFGWLRWARRSRTARFSARTRYIVRSEHR